MARETNLFKITLINWNEHNPGKKKTHKKTLISNNLINDAKVLSLPLSHRWLFINLLLICGDYASDTVTLNERQLNSILTTRVGCDNALALLQELQLVTFEKTTSLITELKNNRSNNRSNNIQKTEKPEVQKPPQSASAVDVVVVKNKTIKFSESKQIEIKTELLQSWAETYPKDFLELSWKEMRNWVLSNEHKAPKSQWAKFMNGWFKRGWEHHRKTLGSNPTKLTVEGLDEMLGAL